MAVVVDFALPAELEAHDPPEARGIPRDGVRLMVSRRGLGGERGRRGTISHHRFGALPGLLRPGDLLVVNNSGTLPAAVGPIHFSTPLADGSWLVEPRNVPLVPGQQLPMPAGAVLTPVSQESPRLWRVRLSEPVIPYLQRHGSPIRYSYVHKEWPISAYQTVFARVPGSAEMPSASRPFSQRIVTELAARGVLIAPLTLHTGVASLEDGEDPYPEPYEVTAETARVVNFVRAAGGRVIAAGTTVVRALETAAGPDGVVSPSSGWTPYVVTPETGVRAVDGLLTGLHEPRSSHLRMLAAFAGPGLLSRCYDEALAEGYRWHEFGDVHLLLP